MSNTINSLLAGLTVTTPSQSGKRSTSTDFSTLYGGALASQSKLTAVSSSMGASGQALGMALRPALRAAGISVPPALRFEIDSGTGGIALPGDPREAAVKAMLAGNPALQGQVQSVLGQAKTQRDAALAAAGSDFLKNAKDPRRAQAVLDRYKQINASPAISATFDGVSVGVQEKSGNDWRALKTEKEFSWELAMAYQQYAVDDQTLFDSLMAAVSSKNGTQQGGKSTDAGGKKDAKDKAPLKPLEPGDGAGSSSFLKA